MGVRDRVWSGGGVGRSTARFPDNDDARPPLPFPPSPPLSLQRSATTVHWAAYFRSPSPSAVTNPTPALDPSPGGGDVGPDETSGGSD